MERAERIRGCLLGGAVGDALGAPVEFLSLAQIRQRYGAGGIRELAPAYGRPAAITDDTQMTLWTAEGLLRAYNRLAERGECHLPGVVHRAYNRWLLTQGERPPDSGVTVEDGWLFGVQALHSRRGPGITCLTSLQTGLLDELGIAPNNSKGCGGVMRTAPVGALDLDAFEVGCQLAALTHGHPSGYLAAGFQARTVQLLLAGMTLPDAVSQAKQELMRRPNHDEMLRAVEAAERAAAAGNTSAEVVETLGAGWVGEEALAIALYAALSAGTFEAGVVLAVNHSGDSDSTGAIAGNLLGALHGPGAIPGRWLEALELREVIAAVAADLATAAEGGSLSFERYPPY